MADAPIRRVEGLKGKRVATNAAGSGVDIAMRTMLRKHGLEDKRDYTIVEAPFPTMRAIALNAGSLRCRNLSAPGGRPDSLGTS